MTQAIANVPTAHASRYLQQLCKHWAHKLDVTFDPTDGRIGFGEGGVDGGECRLHAEAETLRLEVQAPDAEQVDRLKGVVERHLVRFAFREELAISWS